MADDDVPHGVPVHLQLLGNLPHRDPLAGMELPNLSFLRLVLGPVVLMEVGHGLLKVRAVDGLPGLREAGLLGQDGPHALVR